MARKKLTFRPGLNGQRTPLLNEGGWSSTNLVRFRDGMAEVMGGWQNLFSPPQTIYGTPRGAHAWASLGGTAMLAYGTNCRLYVAYAITSTTPTNPFGTTNGSAVVTVTDPNVPSGLRAGSGVFIFNATALGGVTLNGSFSITSLYPNGSYSITATSTATSNASGGGTPTIQYVGGNNAVGDAFDITPPYFGTTLPYFSTVNGLAKVTLVDYSMPAGVQVGGLVNFNVSNTNIGGLNFNNGPFTITTVGTNTLTFTANAAATSTTSNVSGGIHSETYYYVFGPVSATPSSVNSYYSFPPPLIWSLDNYGDQLVACPNVQILASYFDANQDFANIFIWSPDTMSGGRAEGIDTLGASQYPTLVQSIFVSNGAEQIIALGGYPAAGGTYSPMLVSWCNNGDYTTWVASSSNNAGDFQLTDGSQLMFGARGAQQNLIWSDTALYSMQFIGGTLVYGFTQIGANCGAIGPQAVCVINGVAFWMNKLSFMMYNGTVTTLDCPIWDLVFKNLNTAQSAKIICRSNSQFNKIRWDWPSLTGSGENDSFCEYDYLDGTWSYSSNAASGGILVARTAWVDVSPWGTPIALDAAGNVWQHEVEGIYSANGAVMPWTITSGLIDIAEGDQIQFVDEIIPDQILQASSGTAQINMGLAGLMYPNDSYTIAETTVTAGTEFFMQPTRGRYLVFQWSYNASAAANTFWRSGATIARIAPDGKN